MRTPDRAGSILRQIEFPACLALASTHDTLAQSIDHRRMDWLGSERCISGDISRLVRRFLRLADLSLHWLVGARLPSPSPAVVDDRTRKRQTSRH